LNLLVILKYCLLFPKKEAVLRLNKFDMRSTIVYLLVLLLLLIVPTEIRLLLEGSPNGNAVPSSVYIIQMLILYPFFTIFLGLIGISLLTFCGLALSKFLHRKLKFPLLWKMTAYSLAKPIFLFVLATALIGTTTYIQLLVFVWVVVNLIRMILVYPKRAK